MGNDVLFGISGGLLSLVGLIAIFISINSQHSIEKARDILLELELFRIDNPQTRILTAKKIRSKIEQYKRLVTMSAPTMIVIVIAILTILFVGVSWIYYLNGTFVIISFFVILSFTLCLILLTQISFIGALPKPKIFKDVNTVHKGISMKDLFAMSLQGRISVKNKQLKRLQFHSPLDIENIKTFELTVHYITTGVKEREVVEYNEFNLVKGRDNIKIMSYDINRLSPNYYLEVPVRASELYNFDEVLVGLLIELEDGVLTVEFSIPDNSDTDIRDPRTIITPTSFYFVPFKIKEGHEDKEYDFTHTIQY
ncbi:hypothetical protein [Pontibacillus marinus]|uniref:Uncharacterized protein n=1 Tax=Pontibacillus marinus BH030004 = DSM 16465 TaxID=1385511 RepID=A0A0A5I5F6_9BACI|nr:hypothetical protein [Pontibacillus marinus]KGX91047.1 hypothetical protein N783_13620 [Pontibacillus marinus BH030004 = DSM 16465]